MAAPKLVVYTNADFELGVRWRSAGVAVEMSDLTLTLGVTPTAIVADDASGFVTLGNVGDEYRARIVIPESELDALLAQPFEYDVVGKRASDGLERVLFAGEGIVKRGAGT